MLSVDCVFIFIDIDNRYGHTRNQSREHVYMYNIQEDIEKHLSPCFHRSHCF